MTERRRWIHRVRERLARRQWHVYARTYDRLWAGPYTDSLAQRLAEVCSGLTPTEIVEVGAGTGLFTSRLLVVAPQHYLACEPLEPMRRQLSQRLPLLEVLPVTLEELQLEPRAGRVVVAANVVHLSPSPMQTLATLRRIAGPDGAVAVLTPSPTADMVQLTLALRRAGTSITQVLRFTLLHLLMSPLTRLSGIAHDPAPADDALRSLCRTQETVASAHLFVLSGIPDHAAPRTLKASAH